MRWSDSRECCSIGVADAAGEPRVAQLVELGEQAHPASGSATRYAGAALAVAHLDADVGAAQRGERILVGDVVADEEHRGGAHRWRSG